MSLAELHPADAERRGIAEGAMVIVENDRGWFEARARIREGIREGVAWAPGIWWAKLSPDKQNVNTTTSQLLTDMGGGPVFYDNLVEIRLHVRGGQILVGHGEGPDHRTALDRAEERVRRQLTRSGTVTRRVRNASAPRP